MTIVDDSRYVECLKNPLLMGVRSYFEAGYSDGFAH